MDIYQEREDLRNKIKAFWQSGAKWSDTEKAVSQRLDIVHAEIVQAELQDPNKPNERFVYSVCGWSKKHGYFRSKRFTSDIIDEAKKELEVAKSDPGWQIPTLIVKERHLRSKSPAMVDFDGHFNNLGFSDHQELIEKHMCGNKEYRWKDIIDPLDNKFTY